MKKNFPGQNLCSGACGGNIRPYTKQRARHGSPFLEPHPPLLRRAPMPSPPRKAIFGPPFAVCDWAGERPPSARGLPHCTTHSNVLPRAPPPHPAPCDQRVVGRGREANPRRCLKPLTGPCYRPEGLEGGGGGGRLSRPPLSTTPGGHVGGSTHAQPGTQHCAPGGLTHTSLAQRRAGGGGGHGGRGPQTWARGRCSVLLSEAGGAHGPLATSPCPSLEPSPSVGGGAHRPLTPSCPPSPCLACPYPRTLPPFPSGGCATGALVGGGGVLWVGGAWGPSVSQRRRNVLLPRPAPGPRTAYGRDMKTAAVPPSVDPRHRPAPGGRGARSSAGGRKHWAGPGPLRHVPLGGGGGIRQTQTSVGTPPLSP